MGKHETRRERYEDIDAMNASTLVHGLKSMRSLRRRCLTLLQMAFAPSAGGVLTGPEFAQTRSIAVSEHRE